MDNKQAMAFVRKLVADRGKMKAAEIIANAARVPLHTAYGWMRRDSIPGWRMDAIVKLAKRATC